MARVIEITFQKTNFKLNHLEFKVDWFSSLIYATGCLCTLYMGHVGLWYGGAMH